MTVELKLVPDGSESLPVEARDESVVSSHLESAVSVSSASSITSWREVRRIVPGNYAHMTLVLDGSKSDYSNETLSSVKNALLNNISGIKAHPDGWHDVTEPDLSEG